MKGVIPHMTFHGATFEGFSNDRMDASARQTASDLWAAERQISWLRWVGLCFWALILWRFQFSSAPEALWTIWGAGVLYAALCHWLSGALERVYVTAWITTLGDPLLAFAICFVTGGVGSVFFPFFYFTLLASAFRFGARISIIILAFNCTLSVLLFFAVHNPAIKPENLFVELFYLVYVATFGAYLARWARENVRLSQSRARDLKIAGERRRKLLQRLIHKEEEERKRIAGELHDRMSERLFTLQRRIDQCADLQAENRELHGQLDAIVEEAKACSDVVRRFMNELWPTVIDDLGFCEALGEYITGLSETGSYTFDISLSIDPSLKRWRSKSGGMLFRIVQEALLNARKHASATKVDISFSREGDEFVLVISDNGVGFDPKKIPGGHYGLLAMRERANALGGDIRIESAVQGGVKIIVRFANHNEEGEHD